MNDENFPPLHKKPPDPTESSMDTEHPPTTDQEKCDRMQFLAEEVIFVFDEINFLNLTLARMNASKYRKSSRNLEQTQKKAEEQGRLAEQLKGELLSLGSCPIQDCPTHSNLNATQVLIQKKEDALKLQILLATNISKSNNNVTENNIPKKSQETKRRRTV
ncbi:hypothetical protein TNCV_2501241 [Trichonephila clavipes]|nr:hypothetical protein TNCV_2501241 [Trichonephila clavipes]